MGQRIGQAITWGTLSAPQLFTGLCTGYSYDDKFKEDIEDDGGGEKVAVILHSQMVDLSFSAKVTSSSTNFFDLSTGSLMTVSGISSGAVLAKRAVERWENGKVKTASIEALYLPSSTTTGGVAPTAASAFTPATQSGFSMIYPGGVLIWGTNPMAHSAGVLHMLEIAQQVTIEPDEVDPTGVILGAQSFGYMRTLQAHILAKASAPANGTVFSLTNGVTNSANYRINSVKTVFAEKRGEMYELSATWIPPFG